jgi:hypothetical protein
LSPATLLSDFLIPCPDVDAADPIEDYLAALPLFGGLADDEQLDRGAEAHRQDVQGR